MPSKTPLPFLAFSKQNQRRDKKFVSDRDGDFEDGIDTPTAHLFWACGNAGSKCMCWVINHATWSWRAKTCGWEKKV